MTDSDSQPVGQAVEGPVAMVAVDVLVAMVDLKDMAAAAAIVAEEDPADKVVDVEDMVAETGVAVVGTQQLHRPRAYIPRVNILRTAAAAAAAAAAVEDILVGGRRSGWHRMKC